MSRRVFELTWAQAAAWRAHRHHLDQRAPAGSLLSVASRLCGLHAQVMSSAELTAWARIEDLGRDVVQRALWEERTLVKTWAMRGTLHLLPSAELPLWCAALSAYDPFLSPARWKRNFGISIAQLDRLTGAIAAALDGRMLTREELAVEVARTGSRKLAADVAQSSWGTLLRPAAFAGRLCFAPNLGQRVRFTSPATWLHLPAAKHDPPTAMADVTRRFLAAYGPATYNDLARWWGGNGVIAARQWTDSLGEEVAPVDMEGTRAWMLASDIPEMRELSPVRSVRLLPAFDPYVVAASPHAAHLLPGDFRRRVYRSAGWISPVLLVNGLIHGVWRHEIKASRVEIVIEPFVSLPQWARRAAAGEAARLAVFLNLRLRLAWKS